MLESIEKIDSLIPQKPEKEMSSLERHEPVGEVILGSENPELMTREEFGNSQELLFHGTNEGFNFSRSRDYQNEKYWHSSTAGFGFYATNNIKDAQLYSEAFLNDNNAARPLLVEIMPYQAKMFDFRDNETAGVNAPVPENLLNSYISWMNDFHNKKLEEEAGKSDVPWYVPVNREQYLGVLANLSKKNTDLRAMLSLTGDPNQSNYGIDTFPKFMRENGYDGIIYIEGGDHPQHKNPVSYVFYNLDKIGTYATWHEKELSKNDNEEGTRKSP